MMLQASAAMALVKINHDAAKLGTIVSGKPLVGGGGLVPTISDTPSEGSYDSFEESCSL